jgi:hypothetical protein
MKTQIQTLAQSGHAGDVALAEKIYEHFTRVGTQEYITWKTIIAAFVAHTQKNKIDPIVSDILAWTDYSAPTLATILRTYTRATPALKTAWQTQRISRAAAEIIARLYKRKQKDLQEPVINIYIANGFRLKQLTKLIQKLTRALPKTQDQILATYSQSSQTLPPAPETSHLLQITPEELSDLSFVKLSQLKTEIEQILIQLPARLALIKAELLTRLN